MIIHKHHIVPKHIGGSDDPSNIIRVNVAMHAFLHKILWEEHGRWQDEIAYKHLSSIISNQEAIQEARIKANLGNKNRLGKPKTKDEKEKISKTLMGRKRTKESIEKQRQTITGRKQKDSDVEKRRMSNLGKKREIVMCPHCGKTGGINAMKIHHFDKCKQKVI